MPARPRSQQLAAERAASIRIEIGRNLRAARRDADVSLEAMAHKAGMSGSQASRIERALAPGLTFEQAARLGAAVGLDLSARLYPAGDPIRDVAHVALVERLRACLHPGLAIATEVPLPISGDRRAWDAVIRAADWRLPVEAETRPRDVQALDRRIGLKLRDSGFDQVLLLLLDSPANRRLLRSGAIPARFTVDGRIALARLAAGRHPGGSAVVLL